MSSLAESKNRLLRPVSPTYSEMFSGRVYQVGEGSVAIRNHSSEARHTVIGVHGFLENFCYYTQSYQAADTELILLTCSGYHLPVSGPTVMTADWQTDIDAPAGTISHDAAILIQALANLPTAPHVRIHGHSRGCAVIIEAASLRPDLFINVEVVLEAPVLPEGRLHPLVRRLIRPMNHTTWPLLIRLITSAPSASYAPTFFGTLTNRKRQLMPHIFTSIKEYMTLVHNIEDLRDWMMSRDCSAYDNVPNGTILIPRVDRVLDRAAMLRSARQSHNAISIVETDASSHFITLDCGSWIPRLPSRLVHATPIRPALARVAE
ncbi:MAG: alpha/beta hydrolase [unclassified Hahellaceae]|nr:alpha/beta hydrolase [Hahellaceae bacterium]